MLMLVFAVFQSCRSSDHTGEVSTIYVKDSKGKEYPVVAVPGQAIVFFRNSQFVVDHRQIIEKCGGKAIEVIPEINYYLVKTKKGNETAFVEEIKTYREVEDAYINRVSSSHAAVIDVIDDFTTKGFSGYIHGEYVEKSAKSACPSCPVSTHNVKGFFSDASIIREINQIFSNNPDKSVPVLINMSFGESLYRMKAEKDGKYGFITEKNSKGEVDFVRVKWEERAGYTEELWKEERENWAKRYMDCLLKLATWLSKYSDREFIVTKSAGNNGCHKLDSCILQPLGYELSSKQFYNANLLKMLNERIILVSAKDDILYNGQTADNTSVDWWTTNGEYADRPKTYHKWVTKLDISHLSPYPDGHSIDGTSFSSPLLAGHIARLFGDYGFRPENSESTKGMTVKEMVTLIKKLTEDDARKNGGSGLLDISKLNEKVKNLHLNFAGTTWEMVYLSGMVGCTYCYAPRINANMTGETDCRCKIEFFDNGRFRQSGITGSGETIVDEGVYSYVGSLEESNYNYPKYTGIFQQNKLFGEVGAYKRIGAIILKYDTYRSHSITVIDRPIPTPSGKSALLEVNDHRTIGCTMWFGGGRL